MDNLLKTLLEIKFQTLLNRKTNTVSKKFYNVFLLFLELPFGAMRHNIFNISHLTKKNYFCQKDEIKIRLFAQKIILLSDIYLTFTFCRVFSG